MTDGFSVDLKWANHDHGRDGVFEHFFFGEMFLDFLLHLDSAVVLTVIFTVKQRRAGECYSHSIAAHETYEERSKKLLSAVSTSIYIRETFFTHVSDRAQKKSAWL